MSSFQWPPIDQIAEYSTFGAFPPAGPSGSFAYALDTQILYASNGSAWIAIAGPGNVLSMGPFGSAPNADGGSIIADQLILQPADATHPGGVSTTTQTIPGAKTFASPVSIAGSSSGATTIAAAAATTPYTVTLPATQSPGTGGVMEVNSSGTGSWVQAGQANGLATLDSSGKVPVAQLPSVVMEFQGLWDPSTNTPTLADSTGVNGNVYVVTVAFAGPITGLNNVTMVNFNVGDLVIFSAAAGEWEHTTPAAGVSSVNGAQGAVTVNAINQLTGDVTTSAASGSQSELSTLATVNSNVGSFTYASLTVNGKGLVTAASSGTTPLISPMTTLGDIIYENNTPAAARLAGNTSATAAVLTQTGNGTVSAAPAWTTTTGTGSVVLASAPTMSNPVVGTQATTDSSTKAASTAYVTTAIANAVAGVNPAVAVQAATTAASDTSGFTYNNGVSGIGATFTGTNNVAVTIDGFTFTALGQRLLVKNDTQSPSGAFNGIYYVTQVQASLLPPILTRALDYDQPSDMNNTGAIPVVNGTVNSTTSWLLTSAVSAVGNDPLTYVKFSVNPSTVLINPMTNAGDMIYGGASGTSTRLVTGSSGQVPVSAGTSVAFGTLPGNSTVLKAPTIQLLLSTGAQTGWLFTVTGWTGTIVAGDTYTNNGHTYTAVPATQTNGASGQTLFMSGTSATTSTGTDTLTKSVSASGPATISFNGTLNVATATYTTPSGPAPLYLRIRMVGGGAGGASSGSAGRGPGNNGTSSAWSGGILNAGGGTSAFSVQTIQSGGNILNAPGGQGGGRSDVVQAVFGGTGGSSLLGGGGAPGTDGTMTGGAALANSGGGGGGGGSTGTNSVVANSGGSGGGYVEHLITSPASSYAYAVGTGGTGPSAGTNGGAGGNGGSGIIIIEESYQ